MNKLYLLLLSLLLTSSIPTATHTYGQCGAPVLLPDADPVAGTTMDQNCGDLFEGCDWDAVFYAVTADANGDLGIRITSLRGETSSGGSTPSLAVSLLIECTAPFNVYFDVYVVGKDETRDLPPIDFTNLIPNKTYTLALYERQPNEALFWNIQTISPPVLSNDECSGARVLPLTSPPSAYGERVDNPTKWSDFGATESAGGTSCGESFRADDQWFEITIPASGSLVVGTARDEMPPMGARTNINSASNIKLYDACGGTLLECDLNSSSSGPVLYDSEVAVFGQTPGSKVYASVFSGSLRRGYFDIFAYDPMITPPANDVCTGSTPVTCGPPVEGYFNPTSTSNGPAGGDCRPSGTGPGSWFTFTGDGTATTVTVTPTTNDSRDLQLTIASGDCSAPTYVACADESGSCGNCDQTESVTFSSIDGVTYYAYVSVPFGLFRPIDEFFTLSIGCEACASPTNLNLTSRDATEATFSFTAGSALAAHTIAVGAPGFTPGIDNVATVDVPAGTSVGTITGLSSNTAYEAYVTAICNGVAVGPVAFSTSLGAPTNSNCANAQVISISTNLCATPTTGTTEGASAAANNACAGSGGEVWYAFEVPASGATTVLVISDTQGSFSTSFFDACDGTQIGCSGDFDTFQQTDLFGLTPGSTVLVAVSAVTILVEGTFTICAEDFVQSFVTTSGCSNIVTAVVDGSNTPPYVAFRDGPDLLAVIANTQPLGLVGVTNFIDPGAGLRTEPGIGVYLDRQVAINVANQPASPVDVTIFLTAAEVAEIVAEVGSVNGLEDLRFAKVAGANTCSPALAGSPEGVDFRAMPYGGDFSLTASVTSFSEFFIVQQSAVLPVELTRFTASAKTDHNLIEWSVASEEDLDRYVVERGGDEGGFDQDGRGTTVGQVLPKGTSSGASTHYELADRTAPPGTSYYRLRAIDTDGTQQVSDVVAVGRARETTLSLSPNPTHGKTILNVPSAGSADRTVVLTDVSGRELSRHVISAGANQTALDVAGLPRGVYLVRMLGPDGGGGARLVVK